MPIRRHPDSFSCHSRLPIVCFHLTYPCLTIVLLTLALHQFIAYTSHFKKHIKWLIFTETSPILGSELYEHRVRLPETKHRTVVGTPDNWAEQRFQRLHKNGFSVDNSIARHVYFFAYQMIKILLYVIHSSRC